MAEQFPGPVGPARRHINPLTAAIVAVLAAAAGAAVTLIMLTSPASTQSAASPSASPPAGALVPGGAGGGAAGGTLFFGGKVSAVSSTSITIGGQQHTITAAITIATKFTGRATGTRGIKVGDLVTAQITGYSSGHPVAQSIQDPAHIP